MTARSFKIGKVKIANPLILAPMEAVNTASFRLLCKGYGAALVYSPMTDTDKFMERLKQNKGDESMTVRQLLNPIQDERPLTVQVSGSYPEHIAPAVQILSKHADIIDFNSSCPKGDIVGKKAGAYCIKHPNMLERYVHLIKDNTSRPVTCKIRSGWDESSINAVQNALLLQQCGVDAVALHARTKKQSYTGKADWNLIAKVKAKLDIPLIGNGDISSPKGLELFLDKTGCEGAMIGRAAQGNPFIFSDSLSYLQTGILPQTPNLAMKKNAFLKFVSLYKTYEKKQNLSELRDHATWFFKGFKNSTAFRTAIIAAPTAESLTKTIKEFS